MILSISGYTPEKVTIVSLAIKVTSYVHPNLYKALDQHLQIVVEMNNDANDDAFLLLPEVHAVVPVAFHEGQVHSLTRPTAA